MGRQAGGTEVQIRCGRAQVDQSEVWDLVTGWINEVEMCLTMERDKEQTSERGKGLPWGRGGERVRN